MISWEDFSEEEVEPERPKAPRRQAPKAPVVVGAPVVAERKPKKNKSPVKHLLQVIRSSKTCLIALDIEETAQDLRIVRAVQSIPEDEIEMFFRDCGFAEETVLQIVELIQEGRPQMEELSTSILRKTWCLVIQFLLFCIAMIIFTSVGFFVISMGYTQGSCQFSDFTNGTCQQGNVCKLQIAAWHSEGIAYVNEFSPPVASSESAGLKSFDPNGAFRCCNFAQQAALQGSIPQGGSAEAVGALGVGYGSGTPCCNFYNSRTKVFCDNFGTIQQFSHCPAAPWACRLKLGTDDRGNTVVDELRVWEEPVYVLLLIVAGGILGLTLLILGCGLACRHSERLYACGLSCWRCCRWVQKKVGCCRCCKRCCSAICGRGILSFRLGPSAEERARERREAKEEQVRQRQAAFTMELRRTQTFGELDLSRSSWKNSLRRWSLLGDSSPQRSPVHAPPKPRPRPKRKVVKKPRAGRLKVQEAEEDDTGGLRTSSSNAEEDISDSEKSSEGSKENVDDVKPWSIQDLADHEEDVEQQEVPGVPSSRPATMNLQSMLRPIMTPMQPKRRPQIMSQKFGLQDPFATTTSSLASGCVSGYETRSSFGAVSVSSGLGSRFGAGDGMAQTFSEGFGLHGGRRKLPGERRRHRKRRGKDGSSGRAAHGGAQARMAWGADDFQQPSRTLKRRYSEQ